MMATYHPAGIPDEVSGKSPDGSRRNMVWNFTSRVFMTVGVADRLHFEKLLKILAALFGQRNTSALVLAMEARGPNTKQGAS